ncbi:ABC transporter permease [Maribellus sediminis]|uniref:ABC transporter permease n=1 Tax=Maribellus sediminis TaxID=2696285 RepID=UPI0014308B22|nr:ABC transporter permease [Maribellus sediminis]
MLKHYLKYTLRNFKSNRLVFAGSVLSVFLSALCISLLFTYIQNELSMDDFHKREKDIYLLTVQQSPESQLEVVEANLFFDFDYKDYPGVENLVTVKKYKKGELQFSYNQNILSPEGLVVDSTFFEVFDFKLKTGDRSTILDSPDGIVLTERFARQLFGNEDPLGEIVKVTSRRIKNYTVVALAELPPANSSISFDFIIPNHSGGYSRSGGNFMVVNSHFNKTDFVEKIKDLGQKHEQFKDSRMDVMAFNDVYFDRANVDVNGIFSNFGNRRSIRVLMIIIGIVFGVTLLNFSNLQIININSSIKNIGINKISGAGKKHIFFQKLTELTILILLSAILITMAFVLALPYFNQITGVNLAPGIGEIFLLNASILFILITVAMVYPSVVYAKVAVTNSLKNQIFTSQKLTGRNVVATVQFALSLILLISSIVVVKQLDLMLHKDLGFTSKNIMQTKFLRMPRLTETQEEYLEQKDRMERNYQYVLNELASNSSVKGFSQGKAPINPSSMPWKLMGGEHDYSDGKVLTVTPDYKSLLDLTLTEGRFFEKGRDVSRGNQVVINEAAKKMLGIEDISAARVLNKYWSLGEAAAGYEIIGVVKDFNSEHLSSKPQPLYMLYFDDMFANFLIQFEDGATQSGIQFVKQLYDEVNPGEPFSYSFLSDDIEAMYQKEKRLSEIYILFTIIAFAISAIGLFAISLYDTRQRTKEIGVRKVNGAKISEVLVMLNKDFIKWVVLAFAIATPVTYFAMNKWLENFAYKTNLSWWIFALAGLLAMGIALITVSFQSWKAATKNPIEALRYE